MPVIETFRMPTIFNRVSIVNNLQTILALSFKPLVQQFTNTDVNFSEMKSLSVTSFRFRETRLCPFSKTNGKLPPVGVPIILWWLHAPERFLFHSFAGLKVDEL